MSHPNSLSSLRQIKNGWVQLEHSIYFTTANNTWAVKPISLSLLNGIIYTQLPLNANLRYVFQL